MLETFEILANMPLLQLVGGVGFFCLMLGFAAVQFGVIDGNGNGYALLNIAGASLVLVGLAQAFGFAAGLFFVVWIFLGLAGLVMRFFRGWDETMKTIETGSKLGQTQRH